MHKKPLVHLARRQIIFIVALLLLIQIRTHVQAEESPLFNPQDIFHPVTSRNGMVATDNRYATEAGLQILKEGGNAIDAAVTIGFTLAVTYPRAGNIGGGGFLLVYLAKSNEVVAIDYREKAPKAATEDMFLDKSGNVNTEKSRHSYLAVGVPGTVAGLTLALEKYGTVSLERALKPAIEFAERGLPVDEELQRSLLDARDRLRASPASMGIFFKKDGTPYRVGEFLVQRDLAWSLKQIARHGPAAFYKGEIAQKIAFTMKSNGGLITKEDLASYEAVIREPVHGKYRGYDIYSMPPPSSGGVHLIQVLNLLEPFPMSKFGHNTAQTIHLMAESMKLAYADRSKHLGDPDFVDVPVSGLISKRYADELRLKINFSKAAPSAEILPGNPVKFEEDNNTTHFSVMDKYGNAVSNTYTLNFSYGTGITIPGTGILLNNEMDDFSAKPGEPNAYGLIGGRYNAIEPGKRMLSSMTPTIVMKNGKPFLVTGSPGGSRIITVVLQMIMNVIDHGMNIEAATNAVRIHHQWLPDELRVEKGLNLDTIRLLTEKGHKVVVGNTMGNAESVMRIGDFFYGASDPRNPGGLAEGY
ncbi:MAG TPA: gamma-glutamyltransferase [Thermodesulfobacteriota bacterium]|nr:gamma-glutamyltransferase [Thermodesulfobacteriota bacterium]